MPPPDDASEAVADVTVSPADAVALATRALRRCGASAAAAASVAASVVAAEADGQPLVGLGYLPFYCDNLAVGKIVGHALPVVTRPRSGVILVDAAHGFAHPAIDDGIGPLADAARQGGVALLAVQRAYACGALGYHVERVAGCGLVCLGFTNASAMVAGAGGSRPFFGTNPVAIAAPLADGAPLVVDQSTSTVARVAVLDAAARGAVPQGWALDAAGHPTTDPVAALAGSVAPLGGYKGVGLALLVEVMAAGIAGANWSHQAGSLADLSGGPPGIGVVLVAIDPAACAPGFSARVTAMLEALRADPGVRVPGDRRLAARAAALASGVLNVRADVLVTLRRYAEHGSDARAT